STQVAAARQCARRAGVTILAWGDEALFAPKEPQDTASSAPSPRSGRPTARLRAESVVQRVASLSRGSVARYAGSFASAFDNLWFRGLRPCHHRLRSCGPLCGQAKRALASCVETYGQGWGLTVVSLLRRPACQSQARPQA